MRFANVFLALTVLVGTLVLTVLGISSAKPVQRTNANQNTNTAGITPLEEPTVAFGNPMRGAETGAVTIVEFGDFLCGPCAGMESSLAKVLAEYPNDVRLVWKDFPNSSLHEEALPAAIAARCAGIQGAFWEYHDLLLSRQASINRSAYAIFAAELGLNIDEFDQCVAEERTRPVVERDFEEGQRLRVDGTPYLFINKRRVSGALNEDALRGFISAELAAGRQDAGTQ